MSYTSYANVGFGIVIDDDAIAESLDEALDDSSCEDLELKHSGDYRVGGLVPILVLTSSNQETDQYDSPMELLELDSHNVLLPKLHEEIGKLNLDNATYKTLLSAKACWLMWISTF